MKKIEESAIKFLIESRTIDSHWVSSSFLCYKGNFLHFNYHFDRLQKGIKFLTANTLSLSAEEIIAKITQEIDIVKNEFISIKILTNGHDFLFCERHNVDYFKKEFKVKTHLILNENRFINNFIKPLSYDAEKKVLNSLDADEIIFFDSNNQILESVFSNICMVKNEKIFFPHPNEKILQGVMQQVLIEFLKLESGMNWGYENLSKDDILKADELWLLNSLRGLRKVIQIDDVLLSNNFEFYNKVISKFGFFGELY